MSWDVTVQRFSRQYESIAEIPDSERCVALGSSAEVRAAINRFFSAVDWSDNAWGVYESNDSSVEFNMGKNEPNSGFMMHIRASGDVVPTIVAMCLAERWQAWIAARECFWKGHWNLAPAWKTGRPTETTSPTSLSVGFA
jgi:hypothetical protein